MSQQKLGNCIRPLLRGGPCLGLNSITEVSGTGEGTRKPCQVTCKVLLSHACPRFYCSPTTFLVALLRPRASSPANQLLWKNNRNHALVLGPCFSLPPLTPTTPKSLASGEGTARGEGGWRAQLPVHAPSSPITPKRSRKPCLGVEFALGSYFSYFKAAGYGHPTKIPSQF